MNCVYITSVVQFEPKPRICKDFGKNCVIGGSSPLILSLPRFRVVKCEKLLNIIEDDDKQPI